MTTRPRPEQLGDRRYVSLLMRLLVDCQGAVIQGEIYGLEEAERRVPFHGSEGLLQAAHAYLASGPPGIHDTLVT